jgi:RNA polymerase sigma factor (sigma-70 family)
MTRTQGNVVLRHIRGLAAAENVSRLPDRQLLDRFVRSHEDSAFAALVRRHGPLVLGVCRRVLHNPDDAEDAFQATFLALASKAASAGRRASLGTWLYQVAFHTALRARKKSAVRRQHEAGAPPRPQSDPLAEVTGRELLTALDEELHKLPERLRAPLVLCYLEGRARDEAAHELGWSLGTLKRRLEQGRTSLHVRLSRRGISLAALLAVGAGSAAVSAARAGATARAVRLAAFGQPAAVSARVLDLASYALRSAAAGPRMTAGAMLLGAALIVAAAGLLARRAPVTAGDDPPLAPGAAAGAEARPGSPPAAGLPEIVLTGRVVDAKGNELPGAEVGALHTSCRAGADKSLPMSTIGLPGGLEWELLQRAKADGEGRYRLRLPHAAKGQEIALVGVAPGHAVGWEPVEVKDAPPEAVLRLPEEEPVRGRLLDLQGQPTAGVRVHLLKAAREAGGTLTGVSLFQPADGLPFWPAPVTTDAQGRFVLRGVNRTMSLAARAQDDRFALSDLLIEPGQKEEVRQALAPARIIEGRVIREDTREPFPGVTVQVTAAVRAPHQYNSLSVQTDKEGRFRMNHFEADDYSLRTDMVPDAPYFAINRIAFSWPDKLKTRHSLEVVLPHGVLQTGRVLDAATGKPVAGAEVFYLPRLYNNPALKDKAPHEFWERQTGIAATKEDGSFQVPVLPGPGHVAITAPGYVSYVRTRQEIFGHEPLWGFWAASAFVKIDVKPGAGPAEVVARLQPSRPFRGRLVDGEGKPAARARLAVRTFSPDPHRESGIHEEVVEGRLRTGPTIPVKDGAFELPACDPTEAYRVFGLDEENHRGATALLPVRHPEDKPITVRWQECGSATARFVAGEKPAAEYDALLWVREALKPGAGEMRTAAPFGDTIKAGADGKVTLDHLIPGVRYLLLKPDGKEIKEFVVEPGKRLDLGDFAVDAKP